MSIFFTYNDKLYIEGDKVIAPGNRSLQYGDGIFETMSALKGKVRLSSYHFERLFHGMKTLQIDIPPHFTAEYLESNIAALCNKNGHTACARVRLMVCRGSGSIHDPENPIPDYIIQTWDMEEEEKLNSNGLILGVYRNAKKSCDAFSNLKSNNYLPYIMAALHAKELKVNDCLLLNSYGRICDSTIANIFIVKDDAVYTPPLPEGCIAGVMRRFILEKLGGIHFSIIEKQLTLEEVERADEIFLTNSLRVIRWVKQFGNVTYGNKKVIEINNVVRTLLKEN